MVQSPEEKRNAPRHSYASPVTYTGKVGTLAMQPQEVLFQGKIVDLSSGGIATGTRGHPFPEIGALGRARIPPSSRPANLPVRAPVRRVGDTTHGATPLAGLRVEGM